MAYDSVANNTIVIDGVPGGSNPLQAIINVSGSNTLITAAVSWVASVGNTTNESEVVVSSFVDGVTQMDFLGVVVSGLHQIDVRYRKGVATGAHTISVYFDSDPDPDWDIYVTAALAVTSYNDVPQTTPIIQSDSATGLNSPISLTLAGVASGNILVDATLTKIVATAITVGADQTQRVNQAVGTLTSQIRQGMSTQLASDGGAMTWTENPTTADWLTYALEIGQAAAGAVKQQSLAPHLIRFGRETLDGCIRLCERFRRRTSGLLVPQYTIL